MTDLPQFRHAATSLCNEKQNFVLFVEAGPGADELGLEWFAEHRQQIRSALEDFGVVFFRGFSPEITGFESIIDTVAPAPVPNLGTVSPRRKIQGSVYASTDIPANIGIVQHHEMAYHAYTPHFISFYCDQPSEEGGITTLCDSRHISKTVDQEVLTELESKGALYIRNFAAEKPTPLMTWQQSYGAKSKADVEGLLRECGAEWEWVSPTWLRTKQRRPAVLIDPKTGDRVLFGCVLLWSQEYFGELAKHYNFELPDDPWEQWYSSFLGDGSPIPEGFIKELSLQYKEQAVHIPWRRHDFMIVNNLIASHGRTPSAGSRNILATLREPQKVVDLRS